MRLHNSITSASYVREVKVFARLTTPVLIGQVAQTANGFVDMVMAGKVSANDLAAVAIGSSIWVPLYLFMIGIIIAATPVLAQYIGAKKTSEIEPTTHQTFWLGLFINLLGFTLLQFSDVFIPLTDLSPETIEVTIRYLKALAWGFPAISVYMALRCYTESLSHTRPIMIISIIGLLINIPANYILIYGHFGLPALGAEGCGWATALVMTLMSICMVIYVKLHSHYKSAPISFKLQKPHYPTMLMLFKLGLPIALAIFFEVSVFSIVAILVSSLGTEVVAGHQVALNFASLIFMIPLSIGMALTVRVGYAVGDNDFSAAKLSCITGLTLAAILALINGGLLALSRDYIPVMYSSNINIRELASHLLLYAAIFQLADSLQVTANGALRGFKDTRVPMLITLFSYWLIALPLGYTLGLTDLVLPRMGAQGFWVGLLTGLVCAALLLNWRLSTFLRQQSVTSHT